MVHGPLIEELAVARRPGEQHPTRAAALRFTHSGEFGAPTIDAPEIAGERVAQLALRALSSPSEAKKSSCRIIELLAISSSRLSPLITKPGAFAKSSSAS